MKKIQTILICLICLLMVETVWAQKVGRKERRGDRLYGSLAFQGAIDQYIKALRKDEDNASVKLKLAESYRMIKKPDQSAEWFAESIVSMNVTPENKLHYAQVLYSTGNYDLAKTWTEQYLQDAPEDEVAMNMLHSLRQIDSYFKDSAAYEVRSLNINTPAAEFGPAYFKDGIVFASSRVKESVKRKYAWDQTNFLDLFYAERNDSTFQEPTTIGKKINSKYHEGPATFFDNGQKMIFTRNNYYQGKAQRSSEGVNKLNLFYAENYTEANDWTNVDPLPFNSEEYSVGHPSMDEEGTTLYFASDMPGGQGGSDIYVSLFVQGKWDTPKNLGPEINTSGDEMFPFMHEDKRLYFASNGYGGLGGMDLFYADQDANGSYTIPSNLGAPINSSRDDFALILDKEGTKGYFSSQRSGNDDIYSFEILRAQIEVLVLDQSKEESMDSVELKLYDGEIEVASLFSDGQGKVTFDGAIGKTYTVKAMKDGYVQSEESVSTIGTRLAQTTVSLERHGPDFSEADLIVSYQDGKEKVYLANSAAQVFELVQDGNDSYLTDGITRVDLDPQPAADSIISESNDPLGELLSKNKISINETFRINPIYYNFDRSHIRKDASEEMDQMIRLLEKHQYLQIEMSSHTDSRGSKAYNEKLSQRRAEAAVAYLIENGIDANRLEAKGYGEGMLVNKCEDGVSCSAKDHQANRRTEFRIVGLSRSTAVGHFTQK